MLMLWPSFFLLIIVKHERKERLREKLLSQNEPGLDDLGNSQPTQIAKEVKI